MRLRLLNIALAASAFLALGSQGVGAQSDIQSVEVGAQVSFIRLRDISIPDPDRGFIFTRTFDTTVAGFGGRVTYNINEKIALDGEINFFPKDDADSGGRKLQGLLGVKAGARCNKLGIFGKARPGFVPFSNALDCPNDDLSRCGTYGITDFALDLGGVMEFYPTSRAILRFDAGDTVIFNREREFLTLILEPGSPPGRRLRLGGANTHNPQLSLGIGIRF